MYQKHQNIGYVGAFLAFVFPSNVLHYTGCYPTYFYILRFPLSDEYHLHNPTARSFAVGARMAAGMGALLGLIKFRTGSYLPPLIPQEESFEVRRSKRISSS